MVSVDFMLFTQWLARPNYGTRLLEQSFVFFVHGQSMRGNTRNKLLQEKEKKKAFVCQITDVKISGSDCVENCPNFCLVIFCVVIMSRSQEKAPAVAKKRKRRDSSYTSQRFSGLAPCVDI